MGRLIAVEAAADHDDYDDDETYTTSKVSKVSIFLIDSEISSITSSIERTIIGSRIILKYSSSVIVFIRSIIAVISSSVASDFN